MSAENGHAKSVCRIWDMLVRGIFRGSIIRGVLVREVAFRLWAREE